MKSGSLRGGAVPVPAEFASGAIVVRDAARRCRMALSVARVRLPCWRSISQKRGNTERTLSAAESPP